jgi:hypothetical protein
MAAPDNPAYVIGVCPNCHRRADTTEVTPIAIITTGDTEKKCVVTPLLLPDMANLDADLTLGLPPAVIFEETEFQFDLRW